MLKVRDLILLLFLSINFTVVVPAQETCLDYRIQNKTIPSFAKCGIETGWYPRVLVSGPTKESIKAMPIELRPNRPLHFYGNTIRRQHYRGNPLPLPRDVVRTGFSLIRR